MCLCVCVLKGGRERKASLCVNHDADRHTETHRHEQRGVGRQQSRTSPLLFSARVDATV